MSQLKDSDFLQIPSLQEENKSSIDKMLESKKSELQQKILKNPRKHSSSAWVMVFILMITLFKSSSCILISSAKQFDAINEPN